MDMNTRPITLQTEGANNVLVTELREGETLIPYCCKLMETNNIPGILPMRHQSMDGVVRLRYAINGKVRLQEFVTQHHMSYANGILLLRNLTHALLHLSDYFLSVHMCCLDPEQVYVGDGLCAYLVCLPVEQPAQQNAAVRLKAFYEKLLSEYFATADCNSYDDMFKWVYKAALFDLEAFYNRFLKENADPVKAEAPQPQVPPKHVSAPRPAVQPEAKHAPQQPHLEPQEESHEATNFLQKKFKDLQSIYPGVAEEVKKRPGPIKAPPVPAQTQEPDNGPSFAIPGMDGRSVKVVPAAPRTEKEDKSKRGLWPFGARGKEDAAETAENQPPWPAAAPSQPKQNIPAAPPQPAPAEPDWGEGTILVGQQKQMEREVPPQRSVPKAYFVHNGQKVSITQTPFMVGKFNSSVQLHYAIYDNNKVSRSHATFLFENGQYMIRDNQSRNGTTLNGRPLLPLQPVALQDGDEIRLYDEVLTFHLA